MRRRVVKKPSTILPYCLGFSYFLILGLIGVIIWLCITINNEPICITNTPTSSPTTSLPTTSSPTSSPTTIPFVCSLPGTTCDLNPIFAWAITRKLDGQAIATHPVTGLLYRINGEAFNLPRTVTSYNPYSFTWHRFNANVSDALPGPKLVRCFAYWPLNDVFLIIDVNNVIWTSVTDFSTPPTMLAQLPTLKTRGLTILPDGSIWVTKANGIILSQLNPVDFTILLSTTTLIQPGGVTVYGRKSMAYDPVSQLIYTSGGSSDGTRIYIVDVNTGFMNKTCATHSGGTKDFASISFGKEGQMWALEDQDNLSNPFPERQYELPTAPCMI